ncbi:MAG: chromosome segregation protein SMC [Methanomassiliicoccus sp.]|nr:chromosome segregation protein SMC [Methanomassiliicoccus sp.]
MYLKQIELENFKSFGKKLTVPLLEGYTAVTGPNGSGKSNISDAILFVLGPKSSRAIRAGKLTDLIFNGGNNKQPADHCKASLVFDNKDRLIPIDDDIVRLTRLVRRSSEGDGYSSYFYVNDRKSSLGEFDMLLSNARISADGYNFVQQGDVTRVVTMSNLERRRILDEISGIAKFDEEILKAQGERGEADANIDRISIILSELQRQIDQLEQEKEVAMTYLRTKETLVRSKAQLTHRQKEAAETEISSTQRQVASIQAEVVKLRERKVQIADRVRELDEGMVQVEKELDAKGGQEFRELKEKIDALKILVARSDDRAASSSQTVEELRSELEDRIEEGEATAAEVTSLVAEHDRTAEQLEKATADLAERKGQLAEVQGKISACDSELADLEKDIAAREKDVREREEAQNRLEMERERLEDRRGRLETEAVSFDEDLKAHEFGITDAEWKIKEIKDQDRGSGKELKALSEEYLQKKAAETRMSREAGELEQAIRTLQRDHARLKAEEEAAGDIARGYNRAVRGMMEARDMRTIRGIHGTIAELAEVDPRYQTALNIAAGNRMQAIIVDDDEVASQCIQYLKRNGLGRATFLPLTKMLDGRPRGKAIMAAKEAAGFAIDLVKFDERYRAAFWYVLGDTVVVDTLDKARRLMGGVRLVTQGGELLEASGAMVGGNVEQSQLKFGAASKGKLEEVASKLDEAIQASTKLQADLSQVRSDMISVEARIRELTGAGGASTVTLGALERQRDDLRAKLAQVTGEKEKKLAEMAQLTTSITDLAGKAGQAREELAVRRTARDEAREKLERLAPREMSQKLKALQAEVAELTGRASELRSARDTLDARIKLTQKRADEIVEVRRQLTEKIARFKKEGEEAAALAVRSKTDLAALRKIEDSMGQEMNGLRQRKEQLFREKTGLEGERDRLIATVDTKGEIVIGLNTRIAQTQVRIGELEEELKQLNTPVVLPAPSMETLKDTIRQCENAINSMGPVNLKAVDDYGEKVKRHEDLSGETRRLEAQRRDLLRLEGDLNEKKKVSLNQVYEAVNSNFRRAYADLSQGGEAELILENKEEPFQGGLAIKAKPKQGKVLRLEALSGGEKSLTALAFIFAIQEYQPSPFYLLDEVDMFLDGINADMVARRVQKSSKTAQFVQISLRKITLTKADHIIGVTKQEGGISHVIMRPNISDVSELPPELRISDEKMEGTS